MGIFFIQNKATAADIRQGLNSNFDELRNTRRPWVQNYDGAYCTYGGKDYDLQPGGDPTIQPGHPDHWKERVITVEVPETAGGLVRERGSWAAFQKVPANSQVDLFIVEGEAITEDGEDLNGRYWRTATAGQYIWVKE